ncbi:hypothetical protein N3K66_001292 [Trichothecium roseum]|uniref:Uncharacterized protein n=1 Tax=Trichothecium roseum TaxID=47278 RepID=A0ACC0VH32_9HYPO|nr:hypothetical protein N3K66_001292 [Trichothecium roseum]
MGKMDLANEEMKRTRNQRKPKSVIERMRRTSEGIEPTQVVMNTQFDVERVKGVYDDDSPVEDAEDPTPPPRKTKTRRKKPAALTEIPANVPRGDRTSRNKKNTRASKILEDLPKIETPTSTTSFSQDVFRDEHKLDSEGSASPTQRDAFAANPLLGQERTMTGHYHYPGAPQQLPGLNFTPINHNHKERDESSIQAQEQRDPSMGVKSEAQITAPLERSLTPGIGLLPGLD